MNLIAITVPANCQECSTTYNPGATEPSSMLKHTPQLQHHGLISHSAHGIATQAHFFVSSRGEGEGWGTLEETLVTHTSARERHRDAAALKHAATFGPTAKKAPVRIPTPGCKIQGVGLAPEILALLKLSVAVRSQPGSEFYQAGHQEGHG